jgi:transposase
MFGLESSDRFVLYNQPCDMRKSFDGLCGLVQNSLYQDPADGKVFIFVNRRRDRVKLLNWQGGGFVLYYKRLEEGVFQIPRYDAEVIRISYAQLVLLIDGISIKNLVQGRRFSSTEKSV